MRDFFAGVGLVSVCGFVLVCCMVACSFLWERAERKVREREQLEKETVQHLARVTGALRIINLAGYRERKANAPSGGHAPSDALLPVPTGGSAQSIVSPFEVSNG